jgi:hypothetical protein
MQAPCNDGSVAVVAQEARNLIRPDANRVLMRRENLIEVLADKCDFHRMVAQASLSREPS